MKNKLTISTSYGDVEVEFNEKLSVEELGELLQEEINKKNLPLQIILK